MMKAKFEGMVTSLYFDKLRNGEEYICSISIGIYSSIDEIDEFTNKMMAIVSTNERSKITIEPIA